MKEAIQMTLIQCGMIDKVKHMENLKMALGTIQHGKEWTTQGTIETEMMTDITHQGKFPDRTLMITFQMAMLQAADKEILLKVIRGLIQGMTIINLILETESQDVTVTHHFRPIVDNKK